MVCMLALSRVAVRPIVWTRAVDAAIVGGSSTPPEFLRDLLSKCQSSQFSTRMSANASKSRSDVRGVAFIDRVMAASSMSTCDRTRPFAPGRGRSQRRPERSPSPKAKPGSATATYRGLADYGRDGVCGKVPSPTRTARVCMCRIDDLSGVTDICGLESSICRQARRPNGWCRAGTTPSRYTHLLPDHVFGLFVSFDHDRLNRFLFPRFVLGRAQFL